MSPPGRLGRICAGGVGRLGLPVGVAKFMIFKITLRALEHLLLSVIAPIFTHFEFLLKLSATQASFTGLSVYFRRRAAP